MFRELGGLTPPRPQYEQQMKWEIETKKEVLSTNSKIVAYCQARLTGAVSEIREAAPAAELTEGQRQSLARAKEQMLAPREKQLSTFCKIVEKHDPTADLLNPDLSV